jgi:N-acetyltransferase
VEVSPVTLEGRYVRLEPLTAAHEEPLIAAASDGELWNSIVTVVPDSHTAAEYIQTALQAQAQGTELPFVIVQKKLQEGFEGHSATGTAGVAPASDRIVGTTRFYEIKSENRAAAIGYTWLSASVQRSPVNTETKLLLLTHAFEYWNCIRVELITDVLNQQSRAAILRLGAKEEGVLRNHMIMPNGRIRNSVYFSIIAEEWAEVKARLIRKLDPPK